KELQYDRCDSNRVNAGKLAGLDSDTQTQLVDVEYRGVVVNERVLVGDPSLGPNPAEVVNAALGDIALRNGWEHAHPALWIDPNRDDSAARRHLGGYVEEQTGTGVVQRESALVRHIVELELYCAFIKCKSRCILSVGEVAIVALGRLAQALVECWGAES